MSESQYYCECGRLEGCDKKKPIPSEEYHKMAMDQNLVLIFNGCPTEGRELVEQKDGYGYYRPNDDEYSTL